MLDKKEQSPLLTKANLQRLRSTSEREGTMKTSNAIIIAGGVMIAESDLLKVDAYSFEIKSDTLWVTNTKTGAVDLCVWEDDAGGKCRPMHRAPGDTSKAFDARRAR